MAHIGGHALGAGFEQGGGRVAQRAGRIDDVIHQDAAATAHITNDVHHFRFAGPFAALVDDGQRRVAQPLGQSAGAHHAAHVGRDDHQIFHAHARRDVGRHDRGGKQIVGGDIEETLNLAGMQIKAQHAISARHGDEIGHQLGRNRRSRARFAILAGVTEIGHHRRDPPRRRASQRVDADQQFHQIVIGRRRGRLDHEHIFAAHIFMNFNEDLFIGKATHRRAGERDFQVGGNRLGQFGIAVAGQNLHVARALADGFGRP